MTQFNYVLRHSAKLTAILISFLVASPLAAQQAQVVFSPPQNVSGNPGAADYPQVAVDSPRQHQHRLAGPIPWL